MTFNDIPSQEIYLSLKNNNDFVNFLKDQNILLSKELLYKDMTQEEVVNADYYIDIKNSVILNDLAKALNLLKDKLLKQQTYYLIKSKVGWREISWALGIPVDEMNKEIYSNVIYAFKYCSVSSFFQNNRDSFIPEYDLMEIEKNEVAKSFMDAMLKEFDKLDCVLGKCCEYLNFDSIPWDLITYLTQLLGFEKSTIDATETEELRFRELAKNILDIYRIRGTDYSFELFFNFFGYNITVREFYFDRRLFHTTNQAGNPETSSINKFNHEFYLTTLCPTRNELPSMGSDEIVMPSDITPQYSLHEFDELCNEYGPEAVLGYSPVYHIKDSNGKIIDTKEYTGKVYKFFKTNLIYYNVGLEQSNPSAKQIKAITKYLDFLTPSYVTRTIKIDTYSKKDDEQMGFDGDGSKKPDAYGNYNGFEMLDGEDWSKDFQDKYVTSKDHINYQYVNENKYKGTEETYLDYKNSTGKKGFRLPIDHKYINKSVNRFLTGATGSPYIESKRLKYYIVYSLPNGDLTYEGNPSANIYPYYTVPPFIPSDVPYNRMENTIYRNTKEIDLLGSESSVKNQIRIADIRTSVDFVTDLSIEDFVNDNDEFNKKVPIRTMNRTLTYIKKYRYGIGTEYTDVKDCFKKNFYGYKFSNATVDNFDNLLTTEEVYNLHKYPEKYKYFNYNEFIAAYNGTLEEGELEVYVYGGYKYPNPVTSSYQTDYIKYLKSFRYELKKEYNGTVSPDGRLVSLSSDYISKDTIEEVREYVNKMYEMQIEKYYNSPKDEWLDPDYISNTLFFVRDEMEYYRPYRVAIISPMCTVYDEKQVFSNIEEANKYFEKFPERKVCNTEFYITGKETQIVEGKEVIKRISDPYVCTFDQPNKREKIIYSTKDGMLYYSNGNSYFDINKFPDFFGNMIIYHKDPNGKYAFRLCNEINGEKQYTDVLRKIEPEYEYSEDRYSIGMADNAEDMHIEILQYDHSWDGYDEIADQEDFIFYNSPHTIKWKAAGFNGEKIGRPIKSVTDLYFYNDLYDKKPIYPVDKVVPSEEEAINEELENDKNNSESENSKYHNSIAQKIVDEICLNTIDNFTNLEGLNWSITYPELPESVLNSVSPLNYELLEEDENGKLILSKDLEPQKNKKYFVETFAGLLSIIEHNMEKITGESILNREYDYYSKPSDFFQDFYRIMYYNNFTPEHFPESLSKDLLKQIGPDAKAFTDEQIKKIKKYYSIAVVQIASIVESISRDRLYYSFVGRWRENVTSSIIREKEGVWTEKMIKECPGLNNLWMSDPFKADPFNPIFFEKNSSEEFKLKTYFIKNNISEEFERYIEYRDEYLYPKRVEEIRKISKRDAIKDRSGKMYYPFPDKTGIASLIDIRVKDLSEKYAGFIDIKNGAREDLLGKDAYSLKGQHVYTIEKDGYYLYYEYDEYGERSLRKMPLQFALTEDSNGDFFIPYNLNYGLTNYSKDSYDKHREIYSEFTELLDLFVASLTKKNDTVLPQPEDMNKYLTQYFYNKLVRLYREAELKDELPIGLSISGKRPMQAYPKLTEVWNGSGGTFSSPSTLLSSYYNNGGIRDTSIKLQFNKAKILVNTYRETTIKLRTTHKDFMKAFGYDYSEYYRRLTLKNCSKEEYDRLSKEMDNMYKKQFACVKPVFIFTDEAHKYYDSRKDNLTVWQRLRSEFTKDYPIAKAITYDSDGRRVVDDEGYIIDKNGMRYGEKDHQVSLLRLKDGFVNGYIEITIEDPNTLQGILDIEEINNFVGDPNNKGYMYSILTKEEEEFVNGYIAVKTLKQRFIDNYISFPKSLEWIEKDENNIAAEYISFGNDKSVDISKRNVYLDYRGFKEKEKNTEENIRNYEIFIDRKGTSKSGSYSLHDEEVIQVSENGHPIDEDGHEIINYNKNKTFEDQNIHPMYKSVEPKKIKTSYDSPAEDDYFKNSKVYLSPDSNDKISIPLGECQIATNEFGKVIIKVPSRFLHTSRINSVKLLFNVPFVVVRRFVGIVKIFISAGYHRIIRRISSNKNISINESSNCFTNTVRKTKSNFTENNIIKKEFLRIIRTVKNNINIYSIYNLDIVRNINKSRTKLYFKLAKDIKKKVIKVRRVISNTKYNIYNLYSTHIRLVSRISLKKVRAYMKDLLYKINIIRIVNNEGKLSLKAIENIKNITALYNPKSSKFIIETLFGNINVEINSRLMSAILTVINYLKRTDACSVYTFSDKNLKDMYNNGDKNAILICDELNALGYFNGSSPIEGKKINFIANGELREPVIGEYTHMYMGDLYYRNPEEINGSIEFIGDYVKDNSGKYITNKEKLEEMKEAGQTDTDIYKKLSMLCTRPIIGLGYALVDGGKVICNSVSRIRPDPKNKYKSTVSKAISRFMFRLIPDPKNEYKTMVDKANLINILINVYFISDESKKTASNTIINKPVVEAK